ncbi:MAG TPA: LytR C-terminal domain-containing protein [Actinomycetota bacterium]|nr:LytR C-terminal domain-containing protein [Actinomycetota bacterium]
MPGKHAPASPRSFYLSVARAVAGGLTAVALIVLIIMVAAGSGGDGRSTLAGDPTTSPSPTVSASPSPSEIPTPDISPTVSTSPTAANSAVRPPSKVKVVVLNGTTRPGLAARVASELEDAGYNVLRPGNANFRAEESAIYYRDGFRDEARAMARKFPKLGRAREATARTTTVDANITVVVGADYPQS